MLKILVFYVLIVFITSIVPPKDPPLDFLENMTRDDIQLERFYVDDSNNGDGTHYQYSELSIKTYIKNMAKIIDKIKLLFEKKVDLNIVLHQIQKQHWVIVSLLKLQEELKISLQDKRVLVYGSTEPWVEAVCLVLGAAHVTTIDYNKLTYSHDQISTFSKNEFDMFYNVSGPYVNSYDFVIGLRAFDHSGLGRYGDTIDYYGDIDSIKQAKTMMKENGIFILTVPIGPDLIIWNLQRRYGRKRLPKLLVGFEEIYRIGWKDDDILDSTIDYRRTVEPVFVLRHKSDALKDEL
jgi:hypothetical protein